MLLIALGVAIPYAYGSEATPVKNTKKEQEIKGNKSDSKSNKSSASGTKDKDNQVKSKDKIKEKDKSQKKDKTNADAKNRNRNLTNKTNLDAYPSKIIGMYASGSNKNACLPALAIYKKTKQWPSLQIRGQQITNLAEKLSCKPVKIKAMDGNFYVAENCSNEKSSSSDRHLIYIKNNDTLRINSDDKSQTYVECNVNIASK